MPNNNNQRSAVARPWGATPGEVMSSDLLSDSLDFVSTEARRMVVDAMHCELFNKGGDLQGNTAEHDVDWWAFELWSSVERNATRHRWETLPQETRDYWYRIARVSLERLPYLLGRIAHRCEVQAEALRSLVKADRLRGK